MIKFKINGIDVECDSATEAQEILAGSFKKTTAPVVKENSADLKIPQQRARRNRPAKIHQWTRAEVLWMFENRHQRTAFAQNNREILKRHTPKAIGMMMNKIRSQNLAGVSRDIAKYIPTLYAGQSTPVRRSLLDPIS